MENFIYRFYTSNFIPKESITMKDDIHIIYFNFGNGNLYIDNYTENIEPNYLFYLPPSTNYKIECDPRYPIDCFILSLKDTKLLQESSVPYLPFLIKVPFSSRQPLLDIFKTTTSNFINTQHLDSDILNNIFTKVKHIINENRIIYGARFFDEIPQRNTHRHSHLNEYQIDYFLHGNGKIWINNKWKRFESGDFFFMPPNVMHEIKCESSLKNDNYCFKFVISNKNFPFDLSESFKLKIPEIYKSKMIEYLRNMLAQYMLETEIYPNHVIDFLSFINKIKSETTSISLNNDNKINDIKEIIELNYSQKLSLDWLSSQVGISPEYLSRLFKKETGSTLLSYINSIRLEKSFQMLKTTDKTIKEISNDCGFLNSQYFIRAFKKKYKDAPLRMRRSFFLAFK